MVNTHRFDKRLPCTLGLSLALLWGFPVEGTRTLFRVPTLSAQGADMPPKGGRVAVVGSGISGLSSAILLQVPPRGFPSASPTSASLRGSPLPAPLRCNLAPRAQCRPPRRRRCTRVSLTGFRGGRVDVHDSTAERAGEPCPWNAFMHISFWLRNPSSHSLLSRLAPL